VKSEVFVAVPTVIATAVEMLPSSFILKMEGAYPCHVLKTAFLTTLFISPISLFSSTYIFVLLPR